MNLPRSPHGVLAHARPSYASKLLAQHVCANVSHLAGDSYIRKPGSHYSSGQILCLKCSK
jgi:hypothetical protein